MKSRFNTLVTKAGLSAASIGLLMTGCSTSDGTNPSTAPSTVASRSTGSETVSPVHVPDNKLLARYVSSGPKLKHARYVCGIDATPGGYTTLCLKAADIVEPQGNEIDNSKIVGSITYSPCYTDPETGVIKLMEFDKNSKYNEADHKQQLDTFEQNVLDVRKFPNVSVGGTACAQEFGTTPAILRWGPNKEGLVNLTGVTH